MIGQQKEEPNEEDVQHAYIPKMQKFKQYAEKNKSLERTHVLSELYKR